MPACFLRQQLDDCATQVVNVRHAFAKISPKHDYQPRNWDGLQMNLFGIWDVGLNRLTYNRQYGVTNTRRQAPRGALQPVAEVVSGRRQDADPVQPAAAAHDPVLRGVVARAVPAGAVRRRASRSSRRGTTRSSARRRTRWASWASDNQCDPTQIKQDIFVWCHNPVQIGVDPDACKADLKPQLDAQGNVVLGDDGNPILRARQGDPRRSTIFWVNEQQNAGPLGYGPPLFDIETGETISGQAYIYGGALDTYAARSRDLVELLLGNQSPEDFVAGTNIKDWVASNQAGASSMPDDAHAGRRAQHVQGDGLHVGARPGAGSAARHVVADGVHAARWKNREDAMYKSNLWGQSQADLPQVRRDKLKGAQLEAMMITPDVMAMGGAAPATDWTSLSEAEKIRVSPLRSEAVRQAINERMDTMRAFGVDFADFADEGVAQRALQIANDPTIPNADPEAMRQQLRKDIFLGGDAARGRAQHGLAPQLPRVVRRA